MISRPKLLILGLDGGTWDLLGPWVEDGLMPNLARLIREGACGELASTLAPCYYAGWASAMTGKNPGKHGMFGITVPGPDGRRRWATSDTIRARKLWHMLGDQGWTVGVVNVPPTFPPEPVNGYLVSDDSRPPDDPRSSYPADFYARLVNDIGGYAIHKYDNSHNISRYLDILTSATRNRKDALCYMMESLDVDFFVMSFEAPERIAYGLWKYLDKREELYFDPEAAPLRDKAIKCFAVIDDAFGQAMRLAGEDGHVIIFSSHGFGPLRGFFLADHFLSDLGFMKLNQLNIATNRLARRLGLAASKPQQGVECQQLTGEHDEMVRWKDSLAFTGHHFERAIYLLKQPDASSAPGKRPDHQEKLNFIQEKLLKLKDKNGNNAISSALKPEEAYFGPYAGDAPDLTVVMADPSIRIKRGVSIREQSCFQDVTKPWGNQAQTGILAAWGKNINRGIKVADASVIDIAPTILHLAGLPVPEDMDGRVLTELLAPGPVAAGKTLRTPQLREIRADSIRLDDFAWEGRGPQPIHAATEKLVGEHDETKVESHSPGPGRRDMGPTRSLDG